MSNFKIKLDGIEIDTIEQLRNHFSADILRVFKNQEIHDWFASRKMFDQMNNCWSIDQSIGDAQILVSIGQLVDLDIDLTKAKTLMGLNKAPKKEELTQEYKPIQEKQRVEQVLVTKQETLSASSGQQTNYYIYGSSTASKPSQSNKNQQHSEEIKKEETPKVIQTSSAYIPQPLLTNVPQFLTEEEVFNLEGVRLANVTKQSDEITYRAMQPYSPTKKPTFKELIITMPKVDMNVLVLAVFVKKNQKVRKRDKIIEYYFRDKYYYILSPTDGMVNELYFTPEAINKIRGSMTLIDLTFRPILTLKVDKIPRAIRSNAVQGIPKLTYEF